MFRVTGQIILPMIKLGLLAGTSMLKQQAILHDADISYIKANHAHSYSAPKPVPWWCVSRQYQRAQGLMPLIAGCPSLLCGRPDWSSWFLALERNRPRYCHNLGSELASLSPCCSLQKKYIFKEVWLGKKIFLRNSKILIL